MVAPTLRVVTVMLIFLPASLYIMFLLTPRANSVWAVAPSLSAHCKVFAKQLAGEAYAADTISRVTVVTIALPPGAAAAAR